MKKEQAQKELFSLALSFLDQFTSESETKHPEVEELYAFVKKTKNIKTQSGAIDSLDSVYKRLNTIVEGKEVDANVLLLAVSSVLYLAEWGYWKGSNEMKAFRLGNNVYNSLERELAGKPEFKVTNRIMARLDDEYQKYLRIF